MRLARHIGFAFVLPLTLLSATRAAEPSSGYAVLISKARQAEPAWDAVAKSLVEKHGAEVISYDGDVDAPAPKVYLAVGNCLMGHVDGKNAMALAWMNNAGVAQMVGYIDLT
jgi:hypothetical protein